MVEISFAALLHYIITVADKTSIFTDPITHFSRTFIQINLGLFLFSLLLPTILFIFTSLGDRSQLLPAATQTPKALLLGPSLLSHLCLPWSVVALFGLPSAAIIFVALAICLAVRYTVGKVSWITEISVALVAISGLLPAIVLLFPGYSLWFYIGTWLMPVVLISKWTAECKLAETHCRKESKDDVEKNFCYILQCKIGVIIIGIGLGIGWAGRKIRFRAPRVEKDEKKKIQYVAG